MMVRRIVDWVVPPGPAERLAVMRAMLGIFLVVYLVLRLPVFVDLGDNNPARFEPLGVWSWLDTPLPNAVLGALIIGSLLLAATLTLGVLHRFVGPATGLCVLALLTYRSSWGQILWFEILVVLFALIIGFSPAADVYRVGLSRKLARSPKPSIAYGWPVRLAALVTVATYVLAGIAKLRVGGLSWLTDESMRNHIAFTAARFEVMGGRASPVAAPLLRVPLLSGLISWIVVIFELAAPFALVKSRFKLIWIVVIWTIHLMIAVTMFVVFPLPLFGIAFAPFVPIEKIVPVSWRPTTALD